MSPKKRSNLNFYVVSVATAALCLAVLVATPRKQADPKVSNVQGLLTYPLDKEHVGLNFTHVTTPSTSPTTTVAETSTTSTTFRPTVPLVEANPSHYSSAPCTTGEHFNAEACPIEKYLGDFTADEITALIQRVFSDDPVWAVKVAQCESHYPEADVRPNAGRAAVSSSKDYGIMQLNRPSWARWSEDKTHRVFTYRPEWDWETMAKEVGPNLWMARIVYDSGGRGQWSCSRVIGMR